MRAISAVARDLQQDFAFFRRNACNRGMAALKRECLSEDIQVEIATRIDACRIGDIGANVMSDV